MRWAIFTIGLLAVTHLAAGKSPSKPSESAASKRPNFLFILADDMGWGDLSCYGHNELPTPNLDRLAKQGLRLTQFYVCSGVCSPSRTAFMTGRYPARFAIHGHLATPESNAKRAMPNWLDPKATTLPKLLKQAGYATAHFGKWHLGNGKDAPPPSEYGFDATRTLLSNSVGWENEDKGPYFRANSTERIFDETIKFIEQHPDQPFYINAWLLLPHASLNPTPEQLKKFSRYAPQNTSHVGTKQIYFASVDAIDVQIGRLMAKLDKLGVTDNTIVVFTSDNGPEDIACGNATHSGIGSPGPFRGRKRSLYEGGIRTPFIVRWPGMESVGGVDNASVVAGVDFLPTICSIAGVKLPESLQLDGQDRSPVLHGKSTPRTNPLMWEWRFGILNHVWNRSPILAIRDGDFKLLMNPDRSRVELYDIPRDPTEYHNIADKHPDKVKQLADQVLAWQKTLPPGPIESAAGKNEYRWPK